MSKVHLEVVMNIPEKPEERFSYDFDQALIQIGRDEHNDIQIPLSTMSRSHCRLFLENGEWFLEDLGSTHGTKLNGVVMSPKNQHLIRSGDRIDLINFHIDFSSDVKSEPENPQEAVRDIVREALVQKGYEDIPFLRVMNGPAVGSEFKIHANYTEVTIGRSPDCDFHVNDVNISRHHAKVHRNWDDIEIEDLGSKNGVLLNGQQLSGRRVLRDADEITLGAVRILYIDPNSKYLGRIEDESNELATDDGEENDLEALLSGDFLEDSIVQEPFEAPDIEDIDDDDDDNEDEDEVDAQQPEDRQPKKASSFSILDIGILLFGLVILAGIVAVIYFIFFGELPET